MDGRAPVLRDPTEFVGSGCRETTLKEQKEALKRAGEAPSLPFYSCLFFFQRYDFKIYNSNLLPIIINNS